MLLTIPIDKEQVYDLIEKMEPEDKIALTEKLKKETFALRLKKLKSAGFRKGMSDKEVLTEVKAVRREK